MLKCISDHVRETGPAHNFAEQILVPGMGVRGQRQPLRERMVRALDPKIPAFSKMLCKSASSFRLTKSEGAASSKTEPAKNPSSIAAIGSAESLCRSLRREKRR